MSEAWQLLGEPRAGGVLIVGDHASNHVPASIDLGIDPALLDLHIARDIGVTPVAEVLIAAGAADAALLGAVSRLVIDFNREPDAAGLIPVTSDGHLIPGNRIDADARAQRIARYHAPYHVRLAELLDTARPQMILSLHSFTPGLASRPQEARPWQIGILYNDDDRLARVALPLLAGKGVLVGDQLPYSGRDLNYTMNHHAEANGVPYLGIEMRQDLASDAAGVERMAAWLHAAIEACRNHLASEASNAE